MEYTPAHPPASTQLSAHRIWGLGELVVFSSESRRDEHHDTGGLYDDPASGTKQKVKEIIRVVDSNKHLTEMYNVGPDGKEFKSMGIVYTRR